MLDSVDQRDGGESRVRLGNGANQKGARAYNDRLVLSLLRHNGALPKAELSRMTGLSAQTLSVIMKRLEADDLVRPRDPVRGRVGQPSIPYELNPDGVSSLGLKIGRRSTELVLANFVGDVIASVRETYLYPTPDQVIGFAKQNAEGLFQEAGDALRHRCVGVGIGMPFEIWTWKNWVAAPDGALDAWRDFDVRAEIADLLAFPVILANDATAACAAEVSSRTRDGSQEFLYIYIGWFLGGGVVLNGNLFPGPTGNAGALGSLPVIGRDGPVQLIDLASLAALERHVVTSGKDPKVVWRPTDDWSAIDVPLSTWIAEAAAAIAHAIVSSTAVIDFQLAVIDGALPASVRERLVDAVNAEYRSIDLRGLSHCRIRPGSVGSGAPALGASMLPILTNFTRDYESLLESGRGTSAAAR